jgi:hypothetical protein
VKDRQIKNIAASVRQRLLIVAKDSGRPFQELLQYFAMERFRYRSSRGGKVSQRAVGFAEIVPTSYVPRHIVR